MKKKKLKKFLNSVCPFTVLEDKVTWGEYIVLQVKAIIGVILFFMYYIGAIALADIVGVAG